MSWQKPTMNVMNILKQKKRKGFRLQEKNTPKRLE